jgi:voltage-gated sodium channel
MKWARNKVTVLRDLLVKDAFIITLIILNTLLLFAEAFTTNPETFAIMLRIDTVITLFFVAEMFIKIHKEGWGGYIEDNWNKLDFAINCCLVIPLLSTFFMVDDFMFIMVLRMLRVSKFFRFFQFVPNIDRLIQGIGRAFKASIFILIAFVLYLTIFSILSCFLFRGVSPELFGNPIQSMYAVFRVFTIEGWDVVSDSVSVKLEHGWAMLAKMYFVFLVLSGGVCGFSLINAIFVDEMVADNNDALEAKVDELNEKVERLLDRLEEKEMV